MGLPIFSSLSGSSFDVVNNANLNVHLQIPIINKAGRGMPFNYGLAYDSSVWTPVSTGGSIVWEPAANWGWTGSTDGVAGSYTYHTSIETCYTQGDPPRPHEYEIYSNFAYTDPFGVSHPFSIEISNVSSTVCNLHDPPTTQTASSGDGSGYTMYANATGPWTRVYDFHGDTLLPPTAGMPGSGSVSDANGNEISFSTSSTTTFTDTLGLTALTVSGSGTSSSPMTYAYTSPPPGGTSQVTVNYSSYIVQTNFGCSGVSEFGATAENLVSSIDLPDGTSYAFTYEQTPGYSGSVTGRLASVKLPAGGTITYLYTGGLNDGINCSDGSGNYLERTTTDGMWTYKETGSAPATTTTVTDPQGNVMAYTFQGIYETERQIYQGSSTLLETVYTCYNGSSAPCNSTAVGLPITERSVTDATDTGLESESNTDYTSYGPPTQIEEYGYGSGAPGGLIRDTMICYATLTNQYILDRPSAMVTYNVTGNPTNCTGTSGLATKSTYGYDGNGNLTSLTENKTPTSTISRSFTYGTGGVLATATDFAGNTTTFTNGDCNDSFPTSVAQPLSITSSLTWDCNTGLVTSVTDPNSQTTSFSYDDLYRLTQTNNPDGGQTSTAYSDASSPVNVVTTTKLNSSQNRTDTTVLDGLGRVSETELNSDPAGADYVNTTYDSLGRAASVTNPYRTSSTGSDTYSYDALGRVTKDQYADGDYSGAYYGAGIPANVGRSTPLCSGVAGYPTVTWDGAGHYRETWTDAFGQVSEADEPDPANDSLTDSSANATCYTYDALGNLTGVNQGGQTRSYTYDMLSRLISATTPESGTTTYSYSGCSGDPSNVCTRTDARGVTTTYAYDALNRLTQKSYLDGTPSANFYYGQASTGRWGSPSLGNPKGRLTSMSTLGGGSTLLTASVFSYDPMGRIKDYWQCTPYNCNSSSIWDMDYDYDMAGDVTSWTHPAGFTITNTINAAQQITQIASSLVDANHPQYLAQNITYTPWGAEQALENGCASSSGQEQGCTDTIETYTYNNRLQPVMIDLGNTSNASADYCLVYNYYPNVGNATSCSVPSQGGYNGGNVIGVYDQDNVNTSLSHTEAHSYDALNRLTSAVATGNSTDNLAFMYDRWGNMTCTINGQTQGPCAQYSFSSASNRITNSGFTYDSAGDLTGDGTNTYQYDAEGREISANGPSDWAATYNAFGQVIQRYLASQGETDSFLWDPSGRLSANWTQNNGWWWDEFAWANGAPLSDNRQFENTVWFLHADRIASTSSVSTARGQLMWDNLYYPWGRDWAYAGSNWGFFAGMGLGWSAIGQIETPHRNYVPGPGRWLTPDPLGGDITNPQSLNRYAYALNNPATLTDPGGLYPWELGNCLFDTVSVSVDGQSQGTYTYFAGCLSVNYPSTCVAFGSEGCIPPPSGFPAGGGGSTPTSAPKPAPPTRLAGGTMHSGTTVCGGPSVFTAVGPYQATHSGSISGYGIIGHVPGGVAINPAIFGFQVGVKGTTAATAAISKITAIAPQSINLHGFPGPPYHVSDIGDAHVLNSVPSEFDLYGTLRGLPTTQEADQFGRQQTSAYIAVDNPNFACPAGYTKF